jgi:hypothetical protein
MPARRLGQHDGVGDARWNGAESGGRLPLLGREPRRPALGPKGMSRPLVTAPSHNTHAHSAADAANASRPQRVSAAKTERPVLGRRRLPRRPV